MTKKFAVMTKKLKFLLVGWSNKAKTKDFVFLRFKPLFS